MSKLIANAHSAADCWNPHYHAQGFRGRSATIFRKWYIKQYHGSVFSELARFVVAPLCVFGGGTSCEYTREASSLGGTYAVCPKCLQVIMCGYLDDKGLNPRVCGCGSKLGFNDYFQPIHLRQPDGKRVVDPAKDPSATLAELCSYEDDGVPSHALASWLVVLASKGLLATGGHLDYSRFEVRTSGVESDQLSDALRRERWVWIDPTTPRWSVKLSDRGRAMLEARGIVRRDKTRKEIDRLHAMLAAGDGMLRVQAVAALAKMLSR